MRLFLALLCAAALAGCAAQTTSTAYVPRSAAPAAAPCAPAPQYVPVRVAPQAAPCAPAPAASPCANGACAVPQASTSDGGYMVTSTRYTLNDQAASAAMMPADLIACGASFIRCLWQRVVDPILPPANASGGYAMSGR